MHRLTVKHSFPLSPSVLYRAWTTGFDTWFAESDTLRVRAEEGAPFFFEAVERPTDGRPIVRHPHYGRFLTLAPDALVALTWVTGALGTGGAETIVTVRLTPTETGTDLELTHEGFATSEACERHSAAWPMVLRHQEAKLVALGVRASGVEAEANGSGATERLRPNRSIPDAALIPVRSYPDIDAAVTWLREVLGGRERLRIPGHRVQLTVGNGAGHAGHRRAPAGGPDGARRRRGRRLRPRDGTRLRAARGADRSSLRGAAGVGARSGRPRLDADADDRRRRSGIVGGRARRVGGRTPHRGRAWRR